MSMNEQVHDFEADRRLIEKNLFQLGTDPVLREFRSSGDLKRDLFNISETHNLVPLMSESARRSLGALCFDWVSLDKQTRRNWRAAADAASELVHDLHRNKNVTREDSVIETGHHPLLAHAVIDFAARTGPALIGRGNVVKVVAAGAYPSPEDLTAAKELENALSHQLMIADEYWERGTDKLLHLCAAEGMAYRRRFYDFTKQEFRSEVLSAKDVIVPDSTARLDEAPRISYEYEMPMFRVRQFEAQGLFHEVPYGSIAETHDPQHPVELLEQIVRLPLVHGFTAEIPVKVTVEKVTQQIIGMEPAFYFPDAVFYTDRSTGRQYAHVDMLPFYTDYHFLPNPFGGFHSYGYGLLLSGGNEAINSLLNEITEQARNYSSDGGVISAMAGLGEDVELDPRKINVVRATTTNLRDAMVMFNSKPPAQALFAVLQLLVEEGRFLSGAVNFSEMSASISATQVAAMSEQAARTASGIYRRLRADMSREFRSLLHLNKVYRSDGYSYSFEGEAGFIDRHAFFTDAHILPSADPALSSDAVKLAIIAMLEQWRGDPTIDQRELAHRIFTLADIREPDKLIAPPPGPDPMLEMEKEKHQLEIEKAQLGGMETMSKMQLMKAQMRKVLADTERVLGQSLTDRQKMELDKLKLQLDSIVSLSEMKLAQRQLELTRKTAERNTNGKPGQ